MGPSTLICGWHRDFTSDDRNGIAALHENPQLLVVIRRLKRANTAHDALTRSPLLASRHGKLDQIARRDALGNARA